MDTLNEAARLFRNTREWIAPTLKQSLFLEKGVLTPEEFVAAGDHLISCCPSWQWCEGEESKLRDYLPRRKQYLVTCNVPCLRRVELINNSTIENNLIHGDLSGDWEAPNLSLLSGADSSQPTNTAKSAQSAADEYADMEDEELMLDEAVAVSSSAHATQSNNSLISSRRYDVSITYDKYGYPFIASITVNCDVTVVIGTTKPRAYGSTATAKTVHLSPRRRCSKT